MDQTLVHNFTDSLYSLSFSLHAALLRLQVIFSNLAACFSSSLNEDSYSINFTAWNRKQTKSPLKLNSCLTLYHFKSIRLGSFHLFTFFTFSYRLDALWYLPALNNIFPSSFFFPAASSFSWLFMSHDSFSCTKRLNINNRKTNQSRWNSCRL